MIRIDPSPILFYFYFFIRSESVRVDPSWSDPDWRSELIRSDFCTCLHRSRGALLISETVQKNFQNHLYGQPALTSDKRQICEEILKELSFNVIKNLLSLLFINGFITMCNLKKRLIRSAFWVLLQAMFMNGWNQTAKRWKLHFWDYQQSIKKYNSVEHLQRKHFIHENKWDRVFKCL